MKEVAYACKRIQNIGKGRETKCYNNFNFKLKIIWNILISIVMPTSTTSF